MSIVCVYTVKIQFDNTSNCKYSIILTTPLSRYAPLHVRAPLFKHSGSAPVNYYLLSRAQ